MCGFWRASLLISILRILVRGFENEVPQASHETTPSVKDLTNDIDLADTCESCLAKKGGWCMSMQKCVEDDTAFCDVDDLIGLAGFTNECKADKEAHKPKKRRELDKGVLVSYDEGTLGIIHRAYHHLEEYTVLLRDGSREEVKDPEWLKKKAAEPKKPNEEDDASAYHEMQFRYFKPHELTVVSNIRPGDIVQSHFVVKGSSDDKPLQSKRTEWAVVLNLTMATMWVNFTSDHIVSLVPRDYVLGGWGSQQLSDMLPTGTAQQNVNQGLEKDIAGDGHEEL